MATVDEFNDWELLNSNSDSESSHDSGTPLDEIESVGLIQVDYFSLDSQSRRVLEEDDDGKSTHSDNPSWIDPGVEENATRFVNKESAEFWSDSSSERSDDRKLSLSEGENEMACSKNMKREIGSEGVRDIVESEGGSVKFGNLIENSEVSIRDKVNLCENSEVFNEFNSGGEEVASGGEVADISGNNRSGEIEKMGVVWWKMPVDFMKYCVFRMSPVWSVSVAAAVMGFLLLGRRLYKMKKKTRGLQIKVAVDDKKISQVMSRAARLNEAFSVVKRVPMIRPTMPAVGSTPWPAMSLR